MPKESRWLNLAAMALLRYRRWLNFIRLSNGSLLERRVVSFVCGCSMLDGVEVEEVHSWP